MIGCLRTCVRKQPIIALYLDLNYDWIISDEVSSSTLPNFNVVNYERGQGSGIDKIKPYTYKITINIMEA